MPDEITREELMKLTPEERIKVLRELRAKKIQELLKKRKLVQEEIEAADELIEETEEEVEEEVAVEEPVPHEEQDSLEEIVKSETPESSEEDEPYKTGAEYKTTTNNEYRPGPNRSELDDRLGQTRAGGYDRERSPEERDQYRPNEEHRQDESYKAPLRGPETQRDILGKMYRR